MNKKVLFAGLLSGLLLVGCSKADDSLSSSSTNQNSNSSSSSQESIDSNSSSSSEQENTETTVPAESVEITGDAAVKVGKTIQLTATVLPETTTDKTITWSSSNEEVATVDATGKVSGVSEGTATIKAVCGEKFIEKEITVSAIIPTKIEIEGSYHRNHLYTEGLEIQLAATISPADATNKDITWTSADPEVATVDATGKVKVLKQGNVKVTATSVGNNAKDDEVFIHAGTVPTGFKIQYDDKDLTSIDLHLGEKMEPDIVPLGNEGDNPLYGGKWTIEDETVAEVSSWGQFIPKKVGTTTATYTSSFDENVKTTFNVNITEAVLPESVDVIDFEDGKKFSTGYDPFETPVELVVSDKVVKIQKDNAQFSKSTAKSTNMTSQAAVLQGGLNRANDAYLEFDFGTEKVSKISFDAIVWTTGDAKNLKTQVKKISIQKFENNAWVDVKEIKINEISGDSYAAFESEVNASKVRIYVEKISDATKKDCRICVDNVSFA